MCSDIWFQMVGHIGCDLSSNLIFIQTTPNDRFWIYNVVLGNYNVVMHCAGQPQRCVGQCQCVGQPRMS